jgi:coenzyme F420-reducing hydrogenase delta subunit
MQNKDKVLVFTCNWNAYSGLETAGIQCRTYSVAVRPIKVMCLGDLSPGIILKAFEHGAAGVLLLDCPPGECYYEFGNRRAQEMFTVTSKLVRLLGYSPRQFQLDQVAVGDGQDWAEKVQSFMAGLQENAKVNYKPVKKISSFIS